MALLDGPAARPAAGAQPHKDGVTPLAHARPMTALRLASPDMPAEPARPSRRRRPTATSAFGVGRRESHDASVFYERFQDPEISADETVVRPKLVDELLVGDARELLATDKYVHDNSVALMVTSPPYYAGKAYEEALGTGHIPGTYKDYLRMLHDVFAAVVPKLEPGGRMAVNVANLGRKPYRSLAADIVGILQDDLRLLLRGEVVWQKALGASGSLAWGSFRSAQNPVLRDVTERVIIASKGRFDRAVKPKDRARAGLPHVDSLAADPFMDATIDLWEMPPESATRVGHPAPFPVGLPHALIDLYTYEDDLVLDPFMGSGTTAVAAIRSRRHYLGVDTDEGYVRAARARCEAEVEAALTRLGEPVLSDGRKTKDVVGEALALAGFTDIEVGKRKLFTGVTVDFAARDATGELWYFDVAGSFTSVRSSLHRTDTVWRAIGKGAVAKHVPYVLLATDRPGRASAAARALVEGHRSGALFDVLEVFAPRSIDRLRTYARGGCTTKPPSALFGE
jgi:DNA modification methylase